MQFHNFKIGLFAALLSGLGQTGVSVAAVENAGRDNSHNLNAPFYLNQNWNDEERHSFYFTPQGSYLLPYEWFLALEQPDNDELFINPKYIERLGYLADDEAYTLSNPDGLPIGFAKEPVDNGEHWVGMTCAACHTGEIRYRGQTIRIDGAPTLGDFTAFLKSLIQALRVTQEQPEKFDRFAQAVLNNPTDADKAALQARVSDQLTWLEQFDSRSTPTHPYGYGRVDAFGIIMNEVFGRDLQQPDNVRVPDAPVSYPFLWTSPRLDWVQWNGSANNPFGRNVGEVLGVFGHVNLTGSLAELGKSTARPRELFELEKLVGSLTSPKWPVLALGPIDSEKAARGRVLYSTSRSGEPSCESCHSLQDVNGFYPMTPADENLFGVSFIETQMTPLNEIGTDPAMSLNFATRKANTGSLAPLLPAPFTGATELPAPVLLTTLVGMAVSNGIADAYPPFNPAERAELIGYRLKAQGLPPYKPKNLLAYRARPLDGIWATAPYLHNGSVPSLYQLLLPPRERQQMFYVGSHEFDPQAVGFRSKPGQRAFKFDASLPGNLNTGHYYGTDLADDERWDLIEFLKTL
ncbi:di-heme-cytochrome C peroxidase [Methylobacter sp. YRD-M1]|uniref:di-heme-cytochrome C peroxidase n=1 Tax=Methylobacter sp. YRD-M1 TaxID=2911520 RepID=UPI00227C0DF5|nr:di-heme-cytochrome C peroxidase [Methylobacter sp. YRD-M1]WAK02931.1 di-heme-cytochrome C peroxidase [Methylobacter sp. YRD-M1]